MQYTILTQEMNIKYHLAIQHSVLYPLFYDTGYPYT